MYSFWDLVHDRWTDRQKKWHIEVGAPPKNKSLNLPDQVLIVHLMCIILMELNFLQDYKLG